MGTKVGHLSVSVELLITQQCGDQYLREVLFTVAKAAVIFEANFVLIGSSSKMKPSEWDAVRVLEWI